MRITLDVDALQPQLTGIGRYTWELACGLSDHRSISRLNLYARGRLIDEPAQLLQGEPRPRRRRFRGFATMLDRLRMKGALFHGPNYFLPAFVERGVVTIHDLSVHRFPETHPAERVADFDRRLGSSIARAVHIITDTETIRREVIDVFGLASERVSAIPLGVDPVFHPRPPADLVAGLSAYGLEANAYGLCVSTLEPRKKIVELIRAWGQLPSTVQQRYPLALAGGGGWRNEEIKAEIAIGAAQGWLKPLGFVPERDLPLLYAGAALFIYPSTYEGFGLPPLEAMASGVPTAVAARSCLPEVCGDAAMFVDPDDLAAFTDRLRQALEDELLRAMLVDRGLQRAASYTWARCIDQTVGLYERCATTLSVRAS